MSKAKSEIKVLDEEVCEAVDAELNQGGDIKAGKINLLTSIPEEPIYEDADLGDAMDLASGDSEKGQEARTPRVDRLE